MEDLTHELARLPHPERMARVLELGRRARAGGEQEARQLEGLHRGTTLERWLAIKSCFTSRDGVMVLDSVEDPSERVRQAARKLVALACDDAQALAALQSAFATRQHRGLLVALRRRGRQAPVDAFLGWLREQPGETGFADVVPYGSPTAIATHLERALERAGFAFWGQMIRQAPAALAALLTTQLAAAPGHPDSRLRRVIDQALPALADRAPAATMSLWRLLRERGVPVPVAIEERLTRRQPGPMVDVVLQGAITLSGGSFRGVIEALSAGQIIGLIERDLALLGDAARVLRLRPASEREAIALAWSAAPGRAPRQGLELLVHLGSHPERRAQVYQAWSHAARDRDGVIGLGQVEQLPTDLAEREARRHLHEVTQLATRPAVRLPYAALLPWAEARAALVDHLGHPEGDVRGPAVATLLRAAGRRPEHPERVVEALGLVLARKNEQDPVRGHMLWALLGWPRAVWQPAHLDAVGQIVRAGLDAADLSHGNAQRLEQLTLRVFHLDGAWGGRWLTTLARERGKLHNARLGELLDDEQVRAFAGALLELATAWSRNERDGALLALCQSLGARLPLVAGLPELLEDTLASASPFAPRVAIMALFFAHDRPRYDRCLPGLLAGWLAASDRYGQVLALAGQVTAIDDGLAAALVAVAERASSISQVENALDVLHTRRRDVFLQAGPPLLARDASYILAPSLLWLVHRRRQDLLTPYLRGDVVRGRFASGQTAWVLPLTAGFERWSPAQHEQYAQTLGRVCADRERDTPTIRWAIRRLESLLYTGGEPLIGLAADDRAAVQELALRALGRLDAGQGIATLLAALDDARARIAIYALRRALLAMPPASAVALLRQVPLRKITVAKEVARLLGELRTEEAYQTLLAVAREVTHRDVRLAVLRALWDHLERDESWVILGEAALGPDWVMASRVGDIPPDRLSDRSERRLSELLARVLDRPEPEARLDLLRRAAALPIRDHDRAFYGRVLRRMESPYHDEIDAAVAAAVARATERDVAALVEQIVEVSLHRQVLERVLLTLGSPAYARSSVARQVARLALERMADDALLVELHARVAARVLSLDEVLARLDQLAARGWLDEFPHVARAPLGELRPDDLERLERTLADRPHHALRQSALAALLALAAHHGWTPTLRERLAVYQRDASPRVAISAQFVFPPREEPSL